LFVLFGVIVSFMRMYHLKYSHVNNAVPTFTKPLICPVVFVSTCTMFVRDTYSC